jgi:hypothetical protein
MHDDPDIPRSRSGVRRTVTFVLMVAAVVVTSVGSYQLVRSVPVLPGLRGCTLLADQPRQIDCIADRVVSEARSEPLGAVLARLDEAAVDDPRIAASCHVAMHRAAAQRFRAGSTPEEVIQATGQGDMDCSIGYLHGSIETAVMRGRSSDLATLAEQCPRVESREGDGREGQCYHGIGHGLRRSGDLADAIDTCRTILSFEPARLECYSGVFMEQTWTTQGELADGSLSPIEPCTDFVEDELAMSACMDYTAQKALVADLDAREIGRLCMDDAPDGWGDECLFGYGRTLPTSSMRACERVGPGEAFEHCARGYLIGNLRASRVFELATAGDRCAQLESIRNRQECARVLGSVVASDTGADVYQGGCKAAFAGSGQLRRSCEKGGQLK